MEIKEIITDTDAPVIARVESSQQNEHYDPRFACNGGGYDQPLVFVEFLDGSTVEIDDESCGDFGTRIDVTANIGGRKLYARYGSMLEEREWYSDFTAEHLPYLCRIADEVGYCIPLWEE